MKNISSFFKKPDRQNVVKYAYVTFLKTDSRTQETEKLCSLTYLLENNRVQQFVKFII